MHPPRAAGSLGGHEACDLLIFLHPLTCNILPLNSLRCLPVVRMGVSSGSQAYVRLESLCAEVLIREGQSILQMKGIR